MLLAAISTFVEFIMAYFIQTVISTLIGAFGGAYAAFMLQEGKDRRKEDKKKSSYLRETIFCLLHQQGILSGLKKKMDPLKNDPLRCIKLTALTTSMYSDIKIQIQNISFILGSKDPDLLREIIDCQDKFGTTIFITKLRSKRHHEELQPIFNKLGIVTPTDIDNRFSPISNLPVILGNLLAGAMLSETDQMYDQVDETLGLINPIIEKLRNYATTTFPNEKFFGIQKI